MSCRWLKMLIFQKQIESLLEEKIGLCVKSVGHERIRRVISQRMASCGITDQSAYLEYLSGSGQEWEELVESVVIPETWFFRNQKSFLFMERYVTTEWLPRNPDQLLRILSIPCATGEEAYSVAMTLTDAGFPLERLHLDGADISARSLRKAAQGIYSRESFREKENIRQISAAVRQKIRWIRGNLLDPEFLINEMPYHVIFCRNLMIYFSDSARRYAISAIQRLLSSEGLLFVGHAVLPLFFLPGRLSRYRLRN
jgi:chemotaxis protein methyltransferase WspC